MLEQAVIVKVEPIGSVNKTKMIRGITVRDDGTLWANINTNPILTSNKDYDESQLKAIHAKRSWGDLPAECFLKLGEYKERGFEVMLWADFAKRRAPIDEQERIKRKLDEMNSLSVRLSSRGWCDFPPVVWTGDVNTPVGQITIECQELLKNGHDVDFPNQSEGEILEKIEIAKSQRLAKKDKHDKAYKEAQDIINETTDATKSAYHDCKGEPDNMVDGIDNTQYWAVSRYSHALDIQHAYENMYADPLSWL